MKCHKFFHLHTVLSAVAAAHAHTKAEKSPQRALILLPIIKFTVTATLSTHGSTLQTYPHMK